MSFALNKKISFAFGLLLLAVLFLPSTAIAQSFGGSTSSSLYSTTNSSAFQNSALSQGSTNTSQATTTLAALQLVTATTAIQVVGAPTSVSANTTKADSSMNTSNEVVLAGFLVGLLALGVLFILVRQLKTTK